MTYGHTEILHKTDDCFLFQKKRIYRPWSAEDTAAINTYFQHYIEDTLFQQREWTDLGVLRTLQLSTHIFSSILKTFPEILQKTEAPFKVGMPFTFRV